ncbi:MAG: sel1 repeat family protein, partial [Opitutae bacterium]|nr:sel1 repeat family protein [Opitutae bacterium]
GNHYYNGDGVPQDYKEALKWYRKAAKCGFVPALHQLGLMYANGEGVPKDNVTACAWLIATGSHLLKADRYLVAARLTPEELAKAQELSRTLVKVPRRK